MDPAHSDTPFWSEGVYCLPQFVTNNFYIREKEKKMKMKWYDDYF